MQREGGFRKTVSRWLGWLTKPFGRRPTPTLVEKPGEPRKLTFLVVDDEAVPRKVVSRSLTRLGHRVLQAEDLKEALAHLENANAVGDVIHGVFTDVHYRGIHTGLGGLELIQNLKSRSEHQETPIVVMSGQHQDEMRNAKRVHGRKVYTLAKPFTQEELEAVLQEAFGEKQQ